MAWTFLCKALHLPFAPAPLLTFSLSFGRRVQKESEERMVSVPRVRMVWCRALASAWRARGMARLAARSSLAGRGRFGAALGCASAPAAGRFAERLVESLAEGRFGAVADGFGDVA